MLCGNLSKGLWIILVEIQKLSHVVSIGASAPLTSVARLAVTGRVAVIVSVESSPLHMHEIIGADLESRGHEIVCDRGESLYDITRVSHEHSD